MDTERKEKNGEKTLKKYVSTPAEREKKHRGQRNYIMLIKSNYI